MAQDLLDLAVAQKEPARGGVDDHDARGHLVEHGLQASTLGLGAGEDPFALLLGPLPPCVEGADQERCPHEQREAHGVVSAELRGMQGACEQVGASVGGEPGGQQSRPQAAIPGAHHHRSAEEGERVRFDQRPEEQRGHEGHGGSQQRHAVAAHERSFD